MKTTALEKEVKQFLAENAPDATSFLLLCSGGQDSMVLADTLFRLGYAFHLLHVNYGLRGAASDADQQLVQMWAQERAIPCHIERAPSNFKDAADLQARARTLRYDAAKRYRAKGKHDAIILAHHANDAAETFLFHAARGTGLDGLVALSPVQGNVMRPFWAVPKEKIDQQAQSFHIPWREDESNATDAYTRNYIRHHVVPPLVAAVPQASAGLHTTLKNLRELQAFVDTSIRRERVLYEGRSKAIPGAYVIYRDVLNHPHSALILWYILRDRGAFDIEAVRALANSQVGAMLERDGWQMWADREGLLLLPDSTIPTITPCISVTQKTQKIEGPFWDGTQWCVAKRWNIHVENAKTMLNLGSLRAPVMAISRETEWVWRAWQEGDFMYPLGMTGRKKVSDILTEAKVPAALRKVIYVLAKSQSSGEVYWVPGARLSRLIAVSDQTTGICRWTEDD
ncbi:MAG: hypothetical protein ABR98_07915 [Cryomorphaceae bacterium BACL7 MAG-120910-bin2]|jgi:tRNA(Ile)-lysidine synthase|nr:MAG: hypothetical protein ABR98_07915 [Cryomorphaceae bacterium BACL7 MAG-120910-bin2]KRO68725.1 MAG: hypothetical protein ABR88_07170 [Cryomorphaceae bacterium BACL7 MAG-120322-bin74]KRO84083.1 MAG: hypothetical protein ABR87_05965 [Cryomorphaceae bacterium BACL7 MAG-121220-bin83]NQW25921.1 tRNA lysidine(34) synthetase TilS [Cryomorphaceae bacterium]|tara:strand:- start:1192 stop:2556 length:1365 start_codon:yes stop_codon:yes gene_type:complete